MRKAAFLFVFMFALPHLLSARTLKDERRIEEEARQSLRPSETMPSVVTEPAPQTTPSPPELAYFQALLSKKYVLRSDAVRLLLMLLGEESLSEDRAQQISLLKAKNIIPVKIAVAFSPDEPLRKGLAAYMFCRALGIKGGLNVRLFGMRERYAVQELVFAGIMPQGSVDDIVSGREFISIFTHAVQYQSEKNEALHHQNLK